MLSFCSFKQKYCWLAASVVQCNIVISVKQTHRVTVHVCIHDYKPEMDAEKVWHTGGCHCKSVRWKVIAPSSVVAWDCNCPNCYMKVIAPSSAVNFELLGDSHKFLTTYTFGTHTAKHTFCKICGITSFYYHPRSNTDGIAVTFKGVDPGTLTHVEIRHADGKNWERAVIETDIASYSKVQK
ncbi:hypothetical protein JHK82_031980 [Glycine max]|nr:hypothetical protein JHK85_032645 [Glycine max]KAG4995249.1 hypothetical protein JHK86_032076 [Glycine max]KAG5125243.1 hypothetical protein JHK82_031980 [Glycine max]KAG5146668.1 hypothetical protein JHK84_032211 [Glycine max]